MLTDLGKLRRAQLVFTSENMRPTGGSAGSEISLLSLKSSSYHNLLKLRVLLSGQQYPLLA
jgi:hypothetical protein